MQNKTEMSEQRINEDFLLLLIEDNGKIDTTTISIDNHFEVETNTLIKLCDGSNDNISEINEFIKIALKPKLPNKIFNYCKVLDKAYQSVYVNIEDGIKDNINKRELIFTNQRLAIETNKEFNLDERFIDFVKNIIKVYELT